VAFLNDGVITMQGKLSEIKAGYRTEKYLLEVEREEDVDKITLAFPECAKVGQTQIEFGEKTHTVHEVMEFITKEKLPVLKIERMEPSLESLFMEVVAK
jgi:ABC-2 type transport system ATP-binding protein